MARAHRRLPFPALKPPPVRDKHNIGLFVTADCDAWDGLPTIFDISRCLREYTDDKLREQYSGLAEEDLEYLYTIPCLFAYESGCEKSAKVGKLAKIQRKGTRLRISYNIDENVEQITPGRLAELSWELGIGDWEMNRTHWALKTEDLYAALDQSPDTVKPLRPVDIQNHIFDVSLSFPGEMREYVEKVAHALSNRLGSGNVFYDNFFKAHLARPSLDTLLQDIYRKRSRLIVAFLCKAYREKEWCGIELRAIRDLLKARKELAIMYVRQDNAEIPGVFSTDGFIDANKHNPVEVADLICERLRATPNITTEGT